MSTQFLPQQMLSVVYVLVIGIMFDKLKDDFNVWLEIGLFRNNNFEYISITQF